MHRSSSTNRFSDDYSTSYYSSSSISSQKVPPALRTLSLEANGLLPIYEPLSDIAKKEKSHAKFAANAVHIIPLVLLLCVFILWFVSNPDVDAPLKGEIIATTIEGLPLEGDLDPDGTEITNLPLDLSDVDLIKQGQSLQKSYIEK
ncbi:hypothetical protein P3L10_016032 [Capsicum annuum]|uniref:uncharacterized protein LOC107872611 n=1 Tax=Capsicum annuum TaxID=4072 RepID=UPI001FB0923B|nr:uncharacterized protein LOC107872611 [Capsicum annuum]XP_047257863.1 uncharacterized protein LOC124890016 [Capsicum annuum]XP_047262123.1 uncharacterized protein LOC124895737 [Capsicum annuum]XP_047262133.1 uncharacterized protein LOC124895745 [Capsicum annuum]XP_047269281.1 uncharacterized protein LOC124898976 [Capsicum annuum]XP_047269289.1 uncharacterized protein LOC124898982 [Capsicum annuum]